MPSPQHVTPARKNLAIRHQSPRPGRTMRRSLLGALLWVAATAAACTEDSVTEPNQMTPPVAFAKGASLQKIRLRVTISDVDATGAAYNIQSDGLGDYVDGSQNVGAFISTSGLLQFDTYTGRATNPATRYMRFDFNDPVDPSNTYRPSPSNTRNYHWAMKSTPVPLQRLGINGNPSAVCTRIGGSFSNSTTSWRFAFHVQDADAEQAAYAVVTRTSISPAVWTMTPVGSCSPNSNVGSLRAADTGSLYGYYRLPFFFTLRQL